jgi:hypothetical protein
VLAHEIGKLEQHALALMGGILTTTLAKTAQALATAASTSAASVDATLASTRPSMGLRQSNVAPDTAST